MEIQAPPEREEVFGPRPSGRGEAPAPPLGCRSWFRPAHSRSRLAAGASGGPLNGRSAESARVLGSGQLCDRGAPL